MKTKRRGFLINTVSSLAAITLSGTILSLNKALADNTIRITKSGNSLNTPPKINSQFLMIESGDSNIWEGLPTKTYRLNDSYPAPTIRINKGDVFSVSAHNMLNEDVSLHFHGFELPELMDGHPKDALSPDDMYKYEFPVYQRAGTYFYHSHTHEKTGKQVNKGLFGFFIVEDEEEKSLGLPGGENEVLLAIQDIRTDDKNQIVYQPGHIDGMEGWLGNRILVNGTPDAFLSVSNTLYRLRIVNASNARIYNLGFGNNMNFHVIATDGGLLEKPVEVNSLMIGPAERYEILADFSKINLNESVMLKSLSFFAPKGHMGNPRYPQGEEYDIIRFDVNTDSTSAFDIPQTLSSITRLKESDAVRTRSFELEMQMSLGMKHTINGKLFDMMRVDESVPFGQTEIWEIINKDNDMIHPFHIHGTQFQILSRNGKAPYPYENGLKDTFLIYPDERVRLLIRFDKYEGMYLLHCHNLEHEDDGMMLNFLVENAASAVEDTNNTTLINIYPNPAGSNTKVSFKPDTKNRTAYLTNSSGASIREIDIPANTGYFNLDVNDLSQGRYWLRIDNIAEALNVIK